MIIRCVFIPNYAHVPVNVRWSEMTLVHVYAEKIQSFILCTSILSSCGNYLLPSFLPFFPRSPSKILNLLPELDIQKSPAFTFLQFRRLLKSSCSYLLARGRQDSRINDDNGGRLTSAVSPEPTTKLVRG